VVDKVWLPCLGSSPNLQVYSSEQEAQIAFKRLKGPRILIDDSGAEVLAASGAPWKRGALSLIREELQRNSFSLIHATTRKQTRDLQADFNFADDNAFISDDFNDPTQAVELPRKKRVLSDSMSTEADAESSRTTRSAFTVGSVEICQSTSSSVYRLLDLGSKTDTVDICQSISSSVCGLLDLDSRYGPVFVED
jgi:hypothetical protein